jgi:hypothetical protein
LRDTETEEAVVVSGRADKLARHTLRLSLTLCYQYFQRPNKSRRQVSPKRVVSWRKVDNTRVSGPEADKTP